MLRAGAARYTFKTVRTSAGCLLCRRPVSVAVPAFTLLCFLGTSQKTSTRPITIQFFNTADMGFLYYKAVGISPSYVASLIGVRLLINEPPHQLVEVFEGQ